MEAIAEASGNQPSTDSCSTAVRSTASREPRATGAFFSALNDIRPTYSQGETGLEKEHNDRVTIQRERQERLRRFVAPECRSIGSAQTEYLPLGLSAVYDAIDGWARRLSQPSKHAARIEDWSVPKLGREIKLDAEGSKRLKGRWDGWTFFYHTRASTPIWLVITEAGGRTGSGYVRACSDHGLVMGKVIRKRESCSCLGGKLLHRAHGSCSGGVHHITTISSELSSSRPNLGNGSRAASPGYLEDSARPAPISFAPPTDHACQSREILDRRQGTWSPIP